MSTSYFVFFSYYGLTRSNQWDSA